MSSSDEDLPATLTATTPLTNETTTLLPQIWGTLVQRRIYLSTVELRNDNFTFGRSQNCHMCVTIKNMVPQILKLISKEHFIIVKDLTAVPYIKDLSKNGTFINGTLIGKGKMISLCDRDIISIGARVHEVYQFRYESTAEINDKFDEKYKITRLVGRGAFGEVYLAVNKKLSQRYAVKRIEVAGRDKSKINNEIKIMERVEHPCIVQMIESMYLREHVYIILEFMEGGELQKRVLSKGKLNETFAKLYAYQIVLAVRYLHNCGITHRDLKPENVLLATNEWNTVVKLTDFGMSKIVGQSCLMRSLCGTPLYVAPEILKGDGRTVCYTPLVDVWSLGCIVYFMLFGRTPFQPNTDSENDDDRPLEKLYSRIKMGAYVIPDDDKKETNVSSDAIDLIKNMLCSNPVERITIEQILKHEWFKDKKMKTTISTLLSNCSFSLEE